MIDRTAPVARPRQIPSRDCEKSHSSTDAGPRRCNRTHKSLPKAGSAVKSSVRSLALPTLLVSLLAVSTSPAMPAERGGSRSYEEAEKLNVQAMQFAQQGRY